MVEPPPTPTTQAAPSERALAAAASTCAPSGSLRTSVNMPTLCPAFLRMPSIRSAILGRPGSATTSTLAPSPATPVTSAPSFSTRSTPNTTRVVGFIAKLGRVMARLRQMRRALYQRARRKTSEAQLYVRKSGVAAAVAIVHRAHAAASSPRDVVPLRKSQAAVGVVTGSAAIREE